MHTHTDFISYTFFQHYPHPYCVEFTPNVLLAIIFLLSNLIITLFVVGLNRWVREKGKGKRRSRCVWERDRTKRYIWFWVYLFFLHKMHQIYNSSKICILSLWDVCDLQSACNLQWCGCVHNQILISLCVCWDVCVGVWVCWGSRVLSVFLVSLFLSVFFCAHTKVYVCPVFKMKAK